jgi:hypothetical protein
MYFELKTLAILVNTKKVPEAHNSQGTNKTRLHSPNMKLSRDHVLNWGYMRDFTLAGELDYFICMRECGIILEGHLIYLHVHFAGYRSLQTQTVCPCGLEEEKTSVRNNNYIDFK